MITVGDITGHHMHAATVMGIERPSHDIDTGIAELVALLARHGDGSLPHLVRRISKRLADPHPGDDVVVLAVRVP
ncbi:hypothetical protein ABT150_24950 [Streptomyces mirabilis]|uniref:hypothetical protein n=1 Tax=Streptomyces mirabilis TaxID=68239 RepID=UPI003332314C